MSKLAHSDDRSMALLNARNAIDSDNEDCVNLIKIVRKRCEHEGCNSFAEFLTDAEEERKRTGDFGHAGTYLCRPHAEEWAAEGGAS